MRPSTAKKIRNIERKWGESFSEHVRGYARMGYSRNSVAGFVKMDHATFYKLCDERGLTGCFLPRKQLREGCKGGNLKARARVYADDTILSWVRKHPSYKDFQAHAPMTYCTVQLRFGSFERARQLAGVE